MTKRDQLSCEYFQYYVRHLGRYLDTVVCGFNILYYVWFRFGHGKTTVSVMSKPNRGFGFGYDLVCFFQVNLSLTHLKDNKC